MTYARLAHVVDCEVKQMYINDAEKMVQKWNWVCRQEILTLLAREKVRRY